MNEWQALGLWLFEFALDIVSIFKDIWAFLNTPFYVGRIALFDWVIVEGIVFTPLKMTGGVAIIILGVGLVSLFVPTH